MTPEQIATIREHIAIARAIPLSPGDAPQLADALANDAEALLADFTLLFEAVHKVRRMLAQYPEWIPATSNDPAED